MAMRWLNKWLARILDWIIGAIMVAIVIVLFIGVVLRYLFNAPLFWSEELTVLGMIWMTFLGGAILVRDDKNVCITILCDMCPPRGAAWIRIVAEILVLGMVAVMIWLSWQVTGRLAFSTTPALRISEAWFGYALIAGFALMLFYQVQKVYALVFRKGVGGADPGSCKL